MTSARYACTCGRNDCESCGLRKSLRAAVEPMRKRQAPKPKEAPSDTARLAHRLHAEGIGCYPIGGLK